MSKKGSLFEFRVKCPKYVENVETPKKRRT